jgi:hypothetical protein
MSSRTLTASYFVLLEIYNHPKCMEVSTHYRRRLHRIQHSLSLPTVSIVPTRQIPSTVPYQRQFLTFLPLHSPGPQCSEPPSLYRYLRSTPLLCRSLPVHSMNIFFSRSFILFGIRCSLKSWLHYRYRLDALLWSRTV